MEDEDDIETPFDHHLVPITQKDFVKYLEQVGKHSIDYYDDPTGYSVTTAEKPGFLYNFIPKNGPNKPEDFEKIMDDFSNKVMKGLTHWQHPRFHAFFPAARNFACILADALASSIGVVGFSYDSSPSVTEMEHSMINWVGRSIGLPESFLFQDVPAESQGGGTIFDSSSEITFSVIVAARQKKLKELVKKEDCETSESGVESFNLIIMHDLCKRFVVYTSKDAHSCIEKGAKIAMVHCRAIQATAENDWGITGEQLEKEIKKDILNGLIPIHVHCTLGTTSTAASDHLQSLWPVAKKYNMWIHVDAAYSGACWVCPKYRTNSAGLEHVNSLNLSGHKLFQHTVGCSFFWTRFQKEYKEAWAITPIFLKPSNDNTVDLRDWNIHLSRRFNSLKTWLLFRLYGVEGLQNYVERLIEMAEYFERLVRNHPNCRIFHKRHFSLFCFQYVEDGLSEDGINSCTQKLCQYMNETHELYFTFTRVDGNSLIRVCTNYEKTTKKTIDESWAIMEGLIAKFKNEWRSWNNREMKELDPISNNIVGRKYHTIVCGNTCYNLWNAYGLTEAEFCELNPGIIYNNLQVGQLVCVRGSPGSTVNIDGRKYQPIVCGSLLYNLRNVYNLTESEFNALNPGVDSKNLQVGQLVCMGGTSSLAAKGKNRKYHKIVSGNTCHTVCDAYGLTNTEFYAMNPGVISDKLQVGQVVCVGNGSTPAVNNRNQRGSSKSEVTPSSMESIKLRSTTEELPNPMTSASNKVDRPVGPEWFASSNEQDKSKILSAEVSGRRALKSLYGTFLRHYGVNAQVDMRDGPKESCEQWFVEDRKGKVVFKTFYGSARFLSARPDGQLDLAVQAEENEMWTPSRNGEQGSWSFRSCDGKYLRANRDNSADLAPHCSMNEQFWLESW